MAETTTQIEAARAREATARRQLLDASILISVCSQAEARNIYAPADVAQLIDRDALLLDDDGRPLNVLEQLDAVLEAKPYLCDLNHYAAARRRQELLANQPRFRPIKASVFSRPHLPPR
jgi:hypothetical protein